LRAESLARAEEDAMSGSPWQTLFSNPDVAAVFAVFGMIVLIVAIPVIAGTWQKVARIRADASLKQSMIERGMSVEEIERVLRAKSTDK
jgi:hypothetical protein